MAHRDEAHPNRPPETVEAVPAELVRIAEKIKSDSQRQKRTHDCVIGASGGLDSTYLIFVAKRLLGLNPLVLCYDNGFRHPCAAENLKNICQQLQCDLRIVPPLEDDKKYIYYSTKASQNIGVYYGPCFSCIYLLPTLAYKAAMEEGAPLLADTNPIEREMETRSHRPVARAILRALATCGPANLLRFLWNSFVAHMYLLKLKLRYEGFSFRSLHVIANVFFNPKPPPKCEVVEVSDLIPWDCPAIQRIIREKLGWKSPIEGSKTPYLRFDCTLECLKNDAALKIMGETFQAMYCNWWVENGDLTREETAEARQYFNDPGRNEEEVRETLKKIFEQ